MTNRNFYAFCRDRRKVEQDKEKRKALEDVYNYLRECGVTKQGVAGYINHRIQDLTRAGQSSDSYTWLQGVFDGVNRPSYRG